MRLKYHSCGQPIGLGYRWNGITHVPVYYNAVGGEQITECPTCAETFLSPDDLVNEPPNTMPAMIEGDEVN